MGLVERIREFVAPAKSGTSAPKPSAGFLSQTRGNILQSIDAPLRKSASDVRQSWTRAAGHAIDITQNSGFIAGMMDQYVTEIVGKGLQLRIRPNAAFLGMNEEQAWQWASEIEIRFNRWGSRPYECDSEDRMTFSKFQSVQCRQHFMLGETVSAIPWRKRFGSQYGTKFKIIPAYMLSDKSNGKDIIHGVKINDSGAALSYFFRSKTAHEGSSGLDIEIAKRDRFGRSQVVHNFDGVAGQLRGITPLAPVLSSARQYDRLQDSTMTAAILQTIFAATITSELPSHEVLRALTVPGEAEGNKSVIEKWMSVAKAWNTNVDIDLGVPGRIPHLMPQEKLDINRSEHPNSNYVDFAKFLLHEIARCLGLTYESATGDYAAATYASLNIGETKNYKLFEARRQNIIAPQCEEIFMSWLEEDIQLGNTKFPGGVAGFMEKRFAAFTTSWRGPGKPQADDLKAAKSYQVLDDIGIASHTEIAEERGRDVEDIYLERQREMALRKRLGLREPVSQRVPDVEEQMLVAENQSEAEPVA